MTNESTTKCLDEKNQLKMLGKKWLPMYVYVNGLTNKLHYEWDWCQVNFHEMEREIHVHNHTKEINEEFAIAKSTGGARREVDAKGEILGRGDSEDVVVVSRIYSWITKDKECGE